MTTKTAFVLSQAFTAVVLLRLLSAGLIRSYPAFSSMLGFVLLRGGIIYFRLFPQPYSVFWMVTETILWIFYLLVLLEIYKLILRRYAGIQSIGRWVLAGAAILSVTLAMLSLIPGFSSRPPDTLMVFFNAERAVLFALAVLVVLMAGFLAWFPVVLPRNVIIHSTISAVYFFSKAFSMFLRNLLGHEAAATSNTVLFGVGLCCMTAWVLLMRPSGELVVARAGYRWEPEQAEQMLGHLRQINASLGHLAKE